MSTLTRAEVRRLFESTTSYKLIERYIDGKLDMRNSYTEIRTIAKVTSTGVYVEGCLWAMTRFDDKAASWSLSADRKFLTCLAPDRPNYIGMALTYELDPEPEGCCYGHSGSRVAACGEDATTTRNSFPYCSAHAEWHDWAVSHQGDDSE